MPRPSGRAVLSPDAGVLKQEISFPQPKNSDLPIDDAPMSFWEQMQAVPDGNWWSGVVGDKGFRVYLYDHEIARSPYIAVINHAFDIEWVKQEFGGGVYRAQLNNLFQKFVAGEIFAIEGESKRKRNPQTTQSAVPPAVPADSFQTQVLTLIAEQGRRTEALLERVIERSSQAAPVAHASSGMDLNIVLKGVVEMFTGLQAKQQTMDPLTMLAALQKLMPQQPDILSMLVKFKEAGLIPNMPVGGDLMAQITALTAVAEKLGWTAGGGTQSPGAAIIGSLIDKGPEIVEKVGAVLDKHGAIETKRMETARWIATLQVQERERQRTAVQPQAPAIPQPAQPQTFVPSQQGIGLEVEPAAHVEPGFPAEAPAAEAPGAEPSIVMDETELLKQRIVTSIMQGATGADIVSAIYVFEPALVETLRGCTVQLLTMYFQNDPTLQYALKSDRFANCMAEIVEVMNDQDEPEIEAPKVN